MVASASRCKRPQHGPGVPRFLVMVGANKSRFKPTVKAILEHDYNKYRGKGGIEPGEADDPLLSGGAGPSSSADAPAPAPA